MTDRSCSVEGCERKHKARGLCNMHYQRWRIHGDAGTAAPLLTLGVDWCSVGGCGRPHIARGLCHLHYDRVRRYGDTGPVDPFLTYGHEGCMVDGCVRPYRARGLCGMHYQRLKSSGDMGGPDSRFMPRAGHCSVAGCVRTDQSVGLCNMHYQRWRASGQAGPPIPARKYHCFVCEHSDVEEIDARLRRGDGGIASAFGVTWAQIKHHRRNHLDNVGYSAAAAAEAVQILNEAREHP